MRFSEKEMNIIMDKKVVKLNFISETGETALVIDFEKILSDLVKNDVELKKRLLSQVLQSDE